MAPDLAAGLDRAWVRLAAAVTDRAAPLRTPVVATAGPDGVAGRVMVLRAVDRAATTLTFFTDSRAAKVAAIAAAPDVAVVGYDPGDRLQLRLRGTADIVATGATVDAAWATLGPAGRAAYRTAAAPGSAAASSEAAGLLAGDGRATFALLVVTVAAIDWLDLAGPGHRRARYHRGRAGWAGAWCVP